MYQEILKQIGLTDKEALVYETLLELGSSTVGQIIKKVKLKRGNTYNILYSLIDKGLVLSQTKEKKTYFQVESPDHLLDLIEEKSETIDQIKKNLTNILPSLKSEYVLTTYKPIVRYYEGRVGLKKIYEDTLKKPTKEILVFRSIYDDKHMNRYLNTYYIKKRARLGIRTKIISPAEITPKKLEEDKKLLKKRKFISKEIFTLPTEIDIYQNKVALLSYRKKLIGIIIENKDIADTLRYLFDLIWKAI